MRFDFATATQILFGPGRLAEVGPLVAQYGQQALVVTSSQERAARLLTLLEQSAITAQVFLVRGEPTIELAQEGVALARGSQAAVVISLGGGSAIDAGKAIAALATNPGHPLDYLEVIGKGQSLTQAPLPFIAIPTTAGTGAEVTKNAVLASPEQRLKVSLRHAWMLPKIALVDPELTYDLPKAITASTGMDALTQCLEPYVSNAATPLTDAIALEGLRRAGRSLRRAYDIGDPDSRLDMAMTSLCGGLALANAKLGAAHGFAGVLGGMFQAPHGALCATLLPHVMAVNVHAMQKREAHHPALERYREVSRLLYADAEASLSDCINWLISQCEHFQIPPLSYYGIQAADFGGIVEKAAQASSMKGNPITLSSDELHEVLARAL
jgi:alcohol dehydrogenase class IV